MPITCAIQAGYLGGPVSPGEIVSLFGANPGPVDLMTSATTGATYPVSLGDVQLTFNGIPAPLVSVRPGYICAVVPFEAVGQPFLNVQYTYRGVASNIITVPVTVANPGLFTADGSATGQALATNQDGSSNSYSNPASAGSVLSLYASGGGLVTPVIQTGAVVPTPAPRLIAPVTVFIGRVAAHFNFAGMVSGAIAGLMRIDVVVPETGLSGSVPATIQVGGFPAQGGITVAIH